MKTQRSGPKALRFAVASALAATLLAGCAGGVGSISGASRSEAALAKRADEKAIKRMEAALLKSPRDAAMRAELGQLYLRAGRFASAISAFDDAMELGENSPQTALGLVLANIAGGNNREAVALLDDWRDSIPASDLGLAMALTGETERGVAILADALRGGENTPKLRQNLAYSYALAGRWSEARIMMIQDVPAEEIDLRLNEWVANARPESHQQRVASLIGAPLRVDPGMPPQLALSVPPAIEQVASERSAEQPVAHELPPAPPLAAELPPAPPLATELPISAPQAPIVLGSNSPAVIEVVPESAPALAPASAPVSTPVPAESHRAAAVPAEQPTFTMVSKPVIQPLPASRPDPLPVRVSPPRAQGNHAVQLGSFSSPQGARRAWGIFAARNPELKNYRMVITPAVVNGRNFWRVAAAGFDSSSARGMCSTVKTRGGVCFAYASGTLKTNPVAPDRAGSGAAFARRR